MKEEKNKKPGGITVYCGVGLALSLVLLVIILLRTLGVIAGGPVAWYLWVSVLLGLTVSLFGLLARDLPRGYQRVVEIGLVILYGGLLLYRLFNTGALDPGSYQFKILIAVVVLLALSPVLAANNRRRMEEERAAEERQEKKRQEELAALRRSMAPTGKEGGQTLDGSDHDKGND